MRCWLRAIGRMDEKTTAAVIRGGRGVSEVSRSLECLVFRKSRGLRGSVQQRPFVPPDFESDSALRAEPPLLVTL